MRRLGFAAALGLLALTAFPISGHAEGEVLVPSDTSIGTDAGASGVDLGLAPAPTDDNSKKTSPSSQQSDMPMLPTIDPGPSSMSTPPPAAGYTPTPPRPQFSSQAGPPSNATQIIKVAVPDPPTSEKPDSVSDGNGFDLGINVVNSTWGKNDVDNLKRRLGLSPNDVQQHCHVSISGMIPTDKGIDSFQMSPHLMHAISHVSGQPTGVTVSAVAICDMLPLPDNVGFVTQMGDKYSIFLQQIECSPPAAGVHVLNFQYSGDGKGACLYE